MNERMISMKELQTVRKYGVQEQGKSGRKGSPVKLTLNDTILILDPVTHKGITAWHPSSFAVSSS
jgi:hypothetical protein